MVQTDAPIVQVDIQIADDIADSDCEQSVTALPTVADIEAWLSIMLVEVNKQPKEKTCNAIELGIRIVGRNESQLLNKQYRQQDKPTNVLSFKSDLPDYIPGNFIGDLVICKPVLINESQLQNKNIMHHWAHMSIHGCLHLLGYDHIKDDDAQEMEALEVNILAQLGIDDPYQISR